MVIITPQEKPSRDTIYSSEVDYDDIDQYANAIDWQTNITHQWENFKKTTKNHEFTFVRHETLSPLQCM